MLTEFERRFVSLLTEMICSPEVGTADIRRKRLARRTGDAAKVFSALERLGYGTFPSDMEDYFSRYQEIGILWRGDRPFSDVGGEISLPHLGDSIALGPPPWSRQGEWPEPERELYSQLRVFDKHEKGGVGSSASLRMGVEGSAPEVWFFHSSRGAVLLDIDYCEYMESLFVTRGFYGWQYLFADISFEDGRYSASGDAIARSLSYLQSTFPDSDYSDLRRRMTARGG
ncbi:hypothetical protein [Streptomyces carpaticus]|uniref:hypothetical protein n=1 Tax=Streptomyces carpaticus TaxID=285558 RepID=UPI0031F888DF